MNSNVVWGLVLIAAGAALFFMTAGNSNRAFPAGIITMAFGAFRVVRGLSAGPGR
jgi:hypothetical protein